VRCSTLLPNIRQQDARQFASAQQINQLEGLAVAIPWGFESPLPHHSTRLPARYASRKARSWRAIHQVECPERAVRQPQAGEARVEGLIAFRLREPKGSLMEPSRHVECVERASGPPQAGQLRVEGPITSSCRLTTTIASSSSDALRLFTSLRRQQPLRRRDFRPRDRERHHNEGRGGSYTAKRRPVQIVYAEHYSSREEALRRERQIKRWSSQKKELLVSGDVAALSGVSQKARVRTGFRWKDWLARPTE